MTRHDTTRHDTTRHDTTRHDTTRHDTITSPIAQNHTSSEHEAVKLPVSFDSIRNIAVIGGVLEVINVISSLAVSQPHIHVTAVIEDYICRNFWPHFFRLNTVDKLKLLIRTAKSHRSARHLNTKSLRKAAAYFTPVTAQSVSLERIPKSAFDGADIVFIACSQDREPIYARTSDYAAALIKKRCQQR